MASRPSGTYAVMAQTPDPDDRLQFFPTPPWATRALCGNVLWPLCNEPLKAKAAWEPACGDGAMARPLAEYFGAVQASDVHAYGFGEVRDFLMPERVWPRPNWIVTNPPFRLGEQFARRAIEIATEGVALLVRTAFLESRERFRLYSEHPPAVVAQFVERVPMVKGRLQRDASTATAYCWIVWKRGQTDTRFKWIPPCRADLDRDSDWPRAVSATGSLTAA